MKIKVKDVETLTLEALCNQCYLTLVVSATGIKETSKAYTAYLHDVNTTQPWWREPVPARAYGRSPDDAVRTLVCTLSGAILIKDGTTLTEGVRLELGEIEFDLS